MPIDFIFDPLNDTLILFTSEITYGMRVVIIRTKPNFELQCSMHKQHEKIAFAS